MHRIARRYILVWLLFSPLATTHAAQPQALSELVLQLTPLLDNPWQHESLLTPLLRSHIRSLNREGRADDLASLLSFVAQRFADIFVADLQEQDPQSAEYYIDLSKLRLGEAHISFLHLQSAKMSHIDLHSALLEQVELRESDLSGCNLRNAELRSVQLQGSDLSDCDLTGAKLLDVDLYQVRLDRAIWLDGQPCAVGSVGQCNR